MRIAVMGVGGIGGYFGARLVLAQEDVTFIARGANLAALQQNGLILKSEQFGDYLLPVHATDDPDTVGEVDLVLFCVKTYDLKRAAEQMRPLIGDETVILPLQNGVDSAERIAKIIGSSKPLLDGLTWVSAHREAPGVIRHIADNRLVFGETSGEKSVRAQRLLDLFVEAKIDARLSGNIFLALWQKFVAYCAGSGICTLTRLPYGPIFVCDETKSLLKNVMHEIGAVGRAGGINISADWVDQQFAYLESMVKTNYATVMPSMYYDLIAGRRLELDNIQGYVVRHGEEYGIPIPLTQCIYAALKPYANGPPDLSARPE